MDWKVIWQPILSTSGPGQSQLRSVELSSVESQGADSAFVCIKSRLVFFAGKHNSVSNKGRPVNLDLSQPSTFPFHCAVSDLTGRTEGVGVLSASGTKNCTALPVCAHHLMFSVCEVHVCVRVCVCEREGVSTRICIHAFLQHVCMSADYSNSCCFCCFPFI